MAPLTYEEVGYDYRMQAEGYTPHGSDKWDHGYLPHYERILGANPPRSVLEIGVQSGASLDLWHKLWPGARIVGIDTDPACAQWDDVVIGDAGDPQVALAIDGNFDLIIDDGSHAALHTFANLANWSGRLNPGGVYVVEDAVIGSTSWIQSLTDTVDALLYHGLTPLAVERSRVPWVAHQQFGGMMCIVFADAICALPDPPKAEDE